MILRWPNVGGATLDSIVAKVEEARRICGTLRCVIPVVCVTNEREENVVKQNN